MPIPVLYAAFISFVTEWGNLVKSPDPYACTVCVTSHVSLLFFAIRSLNSMRKRMRMRAMKDDLNYRALWNDQIALCVSSACFLAFLSICEGEMVIWPSSNHWGTTDSLQSTKSHAKGVASATCCMLTTLRKLFYSFSQCTKFRDFKKSGKTLCFLLWPLFILYSGRDKIVISASGIFFHEERCSGWLLLPLTWRQRIVRHQHVLNPQFTTCPLIWIDLFCSRIFRSP